MKSRLNLKLSKLNIAIVTHVFSSGPAFDLESYLTNRSKNLLFIGHPFSFTKNQSSFYRIYQRGKLKKKYSFPPFKLPSLLLYFKELTLTLLWIFFQGRKIDLYIGSDGYSAYMGLILKKLGKVNKVILYTIDYVPNRFKNPFLNYLYHFFDRQCLKECEIIWNVSPAMEIAREEVKGLNRKKFSPQITVPLGVWYDRIPRLKLSEKSNSSLIYMGHLIEKQGVDLIISSLAYIHKKNPEVKLTIVGTGSQEENLKQLVKKKKLQKIVDFKGYVKSHREVEEIISKSTVGLAMYKPVPENFTYFADPGKLKNYLAAGLPVVLTNVPPIAKDLEKNKCAILSEYDPKQLAEKLLKLINDRKMLELYSKNAISFAKHYDWNDIFKKALSSSIRL